ncbi:MAG: sulfatase-like hydrolase/transferase [bacterium]|nr:sulfatase-like hydrolase/transferase [bacterium]
MHRWIPALVLAASAALAASCGTQLAELDFSEHNLVVITIDTLRADRLGAYGHAAAQTPHLDALARGGVRFESCYSPVPLTLPAHATMFTGKYPFAVGVRVNGLHYLSDGEDTLAELFQGHGFRTFAAVGAYVMIAKFGLGQGFDDYDDSLGTRALLDEFESEIPANRVYRKFSTWLRGRRSQKFFAWVHFYDPHLPYAPPREVGIRLPDDPYDGEIAFVDRYVGKIVDDLRSRGLLDKTLIVVTSDHGEAFLEHGEEGHGLLAYEETIRVPLIFFSPAQLRAGITVEPRVRLVDLMPTLAELFGLAPPAGMQGRSFADLLRGMDEAESRTVYFESMAGSELKNWAPLVGVIVDEHKYVAVPEPELYDLSRDPGEKENLHAQRARVAGRLDEKLEEILRSAGADPTPTRRELSPEDARHLSALGYLSSSARSSNRMLDPKHGIGIDMTLRAVRTVMNEGDLERAGRALEELIAANPELEMPDFYELRHDLAAARNDEETAVAVLEEGVARFPELGPLKFKLASYLFKLRRYAQAEGLCRELLAKDPRRTEALNLLGLVAARRGDVTRAVAWFEQALTIEPRSIPLQTQIADTLAMGGEAARALEIYDGLADRGIFDADADHLFKAAMLNSRFGSPQRAEELFRRGLELEPAGIHHIGFALVLSRIGKIAEAIRHFEIALGEYRDQLTPAQTRLAVAALVELRGAG